MFGVILGARSGPRAALSWDECSRKTMQYSLALLLISRPGARATFGGGSCADQDSGAVNEHNNGCSTCSSFPGACGSYDDDDFTSMEMCCVCGGGLRPPSAPGPPSAPLCIDQDGGATNGFGNDCSAYRSGDCGWYDDDDFTSNEMCRVCGGGRRWRKA